MKQTCLDLNLVHAGVSVALLQHLAKWQQQVLFIVFHFFYQKLKLFQFLQYSFILPFSPE